jgi:hypothetical protein
MIDIDNDITGSAGDITGRKDITSPLVIAGVYAITENRPAISLPSDIAEGSRPRYRRVNHPRLPSASPRNLEVS